MKFIAVALMLLLLAQTCYAEVDLGKTFEQYLGNVTDTISTTTGKNSTDEGGGGDPFSGVKDPMIKWANETFHTQQGWVVAYLIIFLVLAILNVSFILAGVMGFFGFLIGDVIGFQQPSLIAAIFMIIGFVIGLNIMRRSRKVKRLSKGMVMALIIVIILLVAYLALSSMGLLPEWLKI